jgi:hypothetical protein
MESPKRSIATENKRNEMQKTKEAVTEEKDSNLNYIKSLEVMDAWQYVLRPPRS